MHTFCIGGHFNLIRGRLNQSLSIDLTTGQKPVIFNLFSWCLINTKLIVCHIENIWRFCSPSYMKNQICFETTSIRIEVLARNVLMIAIKRLEK